MHVLRKDPGRLVILLLVAVPLPGAVAESPEDGLCGLSATDLRQAIKEVHDRQRNVGLAATLARGDQAVYTEFMGLADLEHEVPVTSRTRFGIASVTKLFTAVTLLRLHAAGKIDLDAKVQTYLPDFPRKPEGDITIRQLATHRSGLPHPQERTPKLFATHYETGRKALEVFADVPLVAAPGTERVYSSSNYNLLAAIIEQVAGKPFPEVVQDEVLEPVGLAQTGFDNILEPMPGRSRRYSFYHPWTYTERQELFIVPTWDYSFNMGGGGLISTTRDLALFGLALTRPGLLPAEQLEILHDEAWFGRKDDDGHRTINTTGANPGVQAGLAIDPERGIAAAVLSNTWGLGSRSGEMAGLARELAGMLAPACGN